MLFSNRQYIAIKPEYHTHFHPTIKKTVMCDENASSTIINVDSRSLPNGFKKPSQNMQSNGFFFCRIQSNKSYGHIHRL